MGIWKDLEKQFAPDTDQFGQADELARQWRQCGHLPLTPSHLLRLDDAVMAAFYARLEESGGLRSPADDCADPGWMTRSDFCFINIRATGTGHSHGNFIQAAKMLPGLRVNAIHLGPFFDYDHETIYAPRSVESLSPLMEHQPLTQSGFGPESQLKALVQACRLTGKAAGMDLEPHVAQFARTVMVHPGAFRWIALSEDKNTLRGGLRMEEMTARDYQKIITAEIAEHVGKALAADGLDSLEYTPGDTPDIRKAKDSCYFKLIGSLIGQGYWTVPSQAWCGLGIPRFKGYNHTHGYAEFEYRDHMGNDAHHYAYHVVTPFAFYHNSGINSPGEAARMARNDEAVSLFTGIFPRLRQIYGLDFVRYDSVDHIIDSLHPHDPDMPASDRPEPEILRLATEKARAGYPQAGNFAERMGSEAEDYAAMGFDLMLGDDMLTRIDHPLMDRVFSLSERLEHLNQKRPGPFSVAFAVDTHDTGNPHIWKEPLVKAVGFDSMVLRFFVSRFAHAGLSRRPKYEAMGSQDLSWGLYHSNVRNANINWVDNGDFNRVYHALEDLYAECRPILDEGGLFSRHVDNRLAWWVIHSPRGALAAVASIETAHGHSIDYFSIPGEKLGLPGPYSVRETQFPDLHHYDWTYQGGQLEGHGLRYKECRLYRFLSPR